MKESRSRAGSTRRTARDRSAPVGLGRPRLEAWKASAGLGTLGIEIVLSVLVGWFGGRALDGWLKTSPYLGIAGLAFGVAAAVRSVFGAWRQMQEITKREEQEQGNPRPVYGADEPEGGGEQDGSTESSNGSPKPNGNGNQTGLS